MNGVRALLFDLFDTVVHFHPQVPVVQTGNARWRSTMGWLQAAAERELPDVAFDDLLAALWKTTDEIVRARPPEFFEVPSAERFRRALAKVGVEGSEGEPIAVRLSLAHMRNLASMTVLPPGHRELLRDLHARFAIGLVSNFDHGPTALQILADHGIASDFDSILVSDDFGRRKPHPSIFVEGLRQLDVDASEALFVGDSLADDVVGAQGAGLRVVWIDRKGEGAPPGVVPDFVIEQLPEMRALMSV